MTVVEALTGTAAPAGIRFRQVLVDVEFLDFEGHERSGQIVVHRDLAREVESIFQEIRAAQFPLFSVIPVVNFGWSDDASMEANNSSGFNYRRAVGKRKLSQHSWGRAVDLNPVQNPYLRDDLVLPPGGKYEPGMPGTLLPDGPVVRAFESRGWTWGGRWQMLKDWHHFEKPAV
jgi:hypothetical protein